MLGTTTRSVSGSPTDEFSSKCSFRIGVYVMVPLSWNVLFVFSNSSLYHRQFYTGVDGPTETYTRNVKRTNARWLRTVKYVRDRLLRTNGIRCSSTHTHPRTDRPTGSPKRISNNRRAPITARCIIIIFVRRHIDPETIVSFAVRFFFFSVPFSDVPS